MWKILVLPVLLFSQLIMAADIRSGSSVTIDKPVYEDLYITAGTIIINAPVYGDLIVAGGTITINDSIQNDILLLGGSITISGHVSDDIRCAGGSISISGRVRGDVLITGGTVRIEKNARLASLYVAGGEVKMNGIVEQGVFSRSGDFELNGTIHGDVDIRGAKININGAVKGKAILAATDAVVIGRSARFARSIRYWQPFKRPLVISVNNTNQQPIFDPLLSISHSKWYLLGASTFLGLLWYLGMAYIMIMIIQLLFPKILSKAGKTFHTKTLKSAVYGIAFFIGVPVSIILFLITIIGVPVSVILAVMYIILILLSGVISSIVIVNWVAYFSNRAWNFWRLTGTALFTFILLKIIFFTPFFGGVLMIAIVAISFGAIIGNLPFNLKRFRINSFKSDQ